MKVGVGAPSVLSPLTEKTFGGTRIHVHARELACKRMPWCQVGLGLLKAWHLFQAARGVFIESEFIPCSNYEW